MMIKKDVMIFSEEIILTLANRGVHDTRIRLLVYVDIFNIRKESRNKKIFIRSFCHVHGLHVHYPQSNGLSCWLDYEIHTTDRKQLSSFIQHNVMMRES